MRLAVGAFCPKHDVELVSDPPSLTPWLAPGASIVWVTVTKFPHSMAAAAARIRLEAEGIPTFVEGEQMGSPAMYPVATDGVKLQVPAELAADARIILSQCWAVADENEIDDDFVEAWDEPAPETSSTRRWAIDAIVVFVLITPLIVWLIARLFDYR